MKRWLASFMTLFLLITSVMPMAQASELPTEEPSEEYDGYIVSKSDWDQLENEEIDSMLAAYRSFQKEKNTDFIRTSGCFTVDTRAEAMRLAKLIGADIIEPDYYLHMLDSWDSSASPTQNQTAWNTMNAGGLIASGILGQDRDTVHDMGGDGSPIDPIVVGVIDSGLYVGHEDFESTRLIPGLNFAEEGMPQTDENGHGTFVTGEIVAALDNGLGINGLASQAQVIPLKVFVGRTTKSSFVINAIRYAVEQKKLYESSHGAQGINICVLNMSLGGENDSSVLKSAVQDAINAGMIVICAAGNDGDTIPSYPAQYAIGVGATDPDGRMYYSSGYSQILSADNGEGYLNKVWVSAPATFYTSTWYDGGYYTGSGTSFAAPQVSALAALALSVNNDLTECAGADATVDNGSGSQVAITNNHDAFKALLKETANLRDYGSGAQLSNGQDLQCGWGIVDFDALLRNVREPATAGKVTFTLRPSDVDAVITVRNNSGTEMEPCGEREYILPNGFYSYQVEAAGYQVCSGSFRVSGAEKTVEVTLEPLPEETLTVSPATLNLKPGKTGKVTAKLTTTGSRSITWYSSDPAVATVNAGKVTAVSIGTCRIYAATEAGTTAWCEVEVAQPITKLALVEKKLPLTVNDSGLIHFTVTDPTGMAEFRLEPTYDSRYLTVEQEGPDTFRVTANGEPVKSTKVTIKDAISKKSATCTVSIGMAANVVRTTMKSTDVSLLLGKKTTLKATAAIAGSSVKPISTAVIWSSDDPSVATVSSKGAVVPQSVGTCTITAAAANGTEDCQPLEFHISVLPVVKSFALFRDGVKTTKADVFVGDTLDVWDYLDPENSIIWKTGTPVTGDEYTITFSAVVKDEVGSFDDETGILTCHGKGTAKVTVKLTCGTQKKTARLSVRILEPAD